MDFLSYKKNNEENDRSSKTKEEDIKSTINKYSKMSEDTLMEELSERYKKEVEEGRMDKEKLRKMVNVLDSYLNETQREKLKNITEKLQDEL